GSPLFPNPSHTQHSLIASFISIFITFGLFVSPVLLLIIHQLQMNLQKGLKALNLT
ncbi:unnamed protein product, partial [Prunus brigantina]